MNKFYSYLLPIAFLIIVYGIAIVLLNDELVAYIGLLVSLIWLNRVADKFNNKIVKVLTLILLTGAILWGILILYVAWGWRAG
jgi:hypothetical protein